MVPNFFGCPVPHQRVGWRVASCYALRQLGSVWQAAGGVAKDPAYAKLLAHTATIAQLMGRNITVGVDL